MLNIKCYLEVPKLYEPIKSQFVHQGYRIEKKLNDIGLSTTSTADNTKKFIYYQDRKYYFIDSIDSIIELKSPTEYIYNCGTNIKLFVAIAALNDTTDRNQWFFSTGWTDFDGTPIEDKWILCDQNTLEHFAWVNNSPNSYSRDIWFKATPEQLFKKFSHSLDEVYGNDPTGIGIKRKDTIYSMRTKESGVEILIDEEPVLYIEKSMTGDITKKMY